MAFDDEKRGINWRTFWYCVFLSLGSLSYGYAASIISTTLGQPVFLEYMRLIDAEGIPASNATALTGATVGLFCVRRPPMDQTHELTIICRLADVLEC